MVVGGNWTCNGNITRPSCYLSPTELGELDAVAAIRMIVSCLSLIGALSIIVSTILKREFFNHKVHPIFVLSIADAMLALLYVAGGIVWLRREADTSSRVWCFTASLPTVILQCVTVNLTVLYALLAYAGVRQTHHGNLLKADDERERVWSPLRTTLSYIVAWLLPVVIVIIPFGIVVGSTGLLQRVNDCSCWCWPSLGNIMPYAHGRDQDTLSFRRDMRKLTLFIASVIGTHFLAGFIVLLVVYRMMIRTIHRMRVTVGGNMPTANYGAVGSTMTDALLLERAEYTAKRRVVHFLIVFIISGLFNLLLCYELMLFDAVRLGEGERMSAAIAEANHQNWKQKFYYITLCLQSVTITQQGFLNAIVYGWTREDFLHIMGVNTPRKTGRGGEDETQLKSELNSSDSEEGEGIEGSIRQTARVLQRSASREENSFNYSMTDTDISDSDYT